MTQKVPSIEPTKTKGSSFLTKGKSTMPLRIKVIDAVAAPKIEEHLLVPSAIAGGRLVRRKAGTDTKPPPPTIESTKPAKAPAMRS